MKRMRDGSYTIKPTYKVGEHDIVPDMLAKRALLHPDQVAVEQRSSVGSTRSLTTAELQRQVEYTACGLIGLGVQAGDAVAILAPTSYEWLLLDLALLGDLALRAGKSGIQTWLSFYLKSPMHDDEHEPVHDLFQQYTMLKNAIREMGGYEADEEID